MLPLAARAQVTPAAACPWRPERDAFAEHERHKQRLNERHWRVRARARARPARRCDATRFSSLCLTFRALPRAAQSLYSNKAFYSEEAIDAHMERRHMDKIPQARAPQYRRVMPQRLSGK